MAVVERIYAEALLAAAKERDSLPRAREHLAGFAAAVEESEELRDFLRNPQVDAETKRAALEELAAGADESVLNFLRLLAEKGRLDRVVEMREELERLVAREERVLELELVTAVELSEEEAAGVVEQIEEASGRKVVATRRVDPDLIGGIVVQAGSTRLDASVRGRLHALRDELTRSY